MYIDEFNDNYLHPLMDKVNTEKKSLILLGDFNINLLNTENNQSVSNFLDIMGSYALLPRMTYPIRVTNNSKTIIDNIFLDLSHLETYSGNITWNISDHLPQFLLNKNIYPDKKKTQHIMNLFSIIWR